MALALFQFWVSSGQKSLIHQTRYNPFLSFQISDMQKNHYHIRLWKVINIQN